ncbi:hypothetical protein H0H92_000453 [Tricholoma furcatifolium]|nr:hypothetical protein H0H92_000453 [Tricholoma furcatifolium]
MIHRLSQYFSPTTPQTITQRNGTTEVPEEAKSTPIVQSDVTASASAPRSNTSLNGKSESHSNNGTGGSKHRGSKSAPISRTVSKSSLVEGIRSAKVFNRSRRPAQSLVEELRQQLDDDEKEKGRVIKELDQANRAKNGLSYRVKLAQGELDDLRHDLDEARQQNKEFTARCSQLIQEVNVAKEQLHRAEALQKQTHQQLIDRTTELQNAQLFLNQADSLSGADIIGIAKELNAEILQVAAVMADSLEYTGAEEKCKDEAELTAVVRMIGEGLTEVLVAQRPHLGEDPTAVQLALQVCLVHCTNDIIRSWTLGGDDSCLSNVYREIWKNENQAAAGRWRSMTQLYAAKLDGQMAAQEIIANNVKAVLEAVDASYQLQWDEFLKKLSNINSLALRLRLAIGQSVTSMDIEPFEVTFGTPFEPSMMEDTYADERKESNAKQVMKLEEIVAGSTELGLLCRVKSVNDDAQKMIMLKSKVVLRSTFAENSMVLKIAGAAYSAYFPTQYLVHVVVGLVTVLALRAFSQGRRTNRERDLHARKILVTGGFTPLGLTLLQSLAERGAHIIALCPHPIDSPEVSIIISLLRTTCSNEEIYAEQCDLNSPSSIRSFCTRFLTGSDQRIDAMIFAHEYQHIGSIGLVRRTQTPEDATSKREANSLATFLITTLLLPALLVAPVERDIRVITVVNPFYAAATGSSFTIPFESGSSSKSSFLLEGTRSLRSVILTQHLQRVLDALPAAQVPKTDEGTSSVPVINPKVQKSNIVAVSVSPGISRVDTIAPLLNADWTSPSGYARAGVALYFLLQPLLRILAKSPDASIQTILHALFLPTPFKVFSKAASQTTAESGAPIDSSVTDLPEEVLKPGALYAECAVVRLRVPVPSDSTTSDEKVSTKKEKGKGAEALEIADDGEYGGEVVGRLVWEAYEEGLKIWEAANPPAEEIKETAPDVDPDYRSEDGPIYDERKTTVGFSKTAYRVPFNVLTLCCNPSRVVTKTFNSFLWALGQPLVPASSFSISAWTKSDPKGTVKGNMSIRVMHAIALRSAWVRYRCELGFLTPGDC